MEANNLAQLTVRSLCRLLEFKSIGAPDIMVDLEISILSDRLKTLSSDESEYMLKLINSVPKNIKTVY